MLEPLLIALVAFALTFAVLRVVEWLYHRLRHTADWSPHWGSWLFAVLLAVYVYVSSFGR
jgi:hypothetical protein